MTRELFSSLEGTLPDEQVNIFHIPVNTSQQVDVLKEEKGKGGHKEPNEINATMLVMLNTP